MNEWMKYSKEPGLPACQLVDFLVGQVTFKAYVPTGH